MSTIKEKLQAIKAIFSATPPPAPNSNAPQTHTGVPSATNPPTGNPTHPETKQADMIANVVGYPIDGLQPIYTDISDDSIAGLDVNDYVFTDESMAVPYADGTYTVTGTDFSFTVSGGQIVSIDNPSGSGAGEPLADIDEPVISIVPPAPTTTDIPVKPTVSPESMKQMYAKQESLETQIRELKTQLSKQELFSKEVLELVEMVANQPTANPTTLPEPKKEGFLSKKEAQLEKMAKAITELKKKQKFS
jgi:hypothetical protein